MPQNKGWFRVYDRVLDSPEVLELSDSEFRMVVSLWALASGAQARDGSIPYRKPALFRRLMMVCTQDEFDAMLTHLVELDLLHIDERGSYSIPRWLEHQYDSPSKTPQAQTQQKRKERGGSVSEACPNDVGSVSEACPNDVGRQNRIEENREEENRTEKKQMQGVREPQDEPEQKTPTASATAPFLEVTGDSAPLNAATPAITSKAPPLPSPLRNPQAPPGWYTDLTANGYTPQEISAAMRVYEERGNSYGDKKRESLVRYFTPLLNDLRERNANSQGLPPLASPAKAREPTPEEVAAREAEDARARELGRQAAERAKQRRATAQQPEIGANRT